jgi:hypothetical protein
MNKLRIVFMGTPGFAVGSLNLLVEKWPGCAECKPQNIEHGGIQTAEY